MRTEEDGFSLIELLVVVLVVGVLAALAIPTFLHQRDKAYQAAMKSDLNSVVRAQAAWSVDHPTPTSDPTVLEAEGYRTSPGVTPAHVKVTSATYVACVRHESASQWLVYDSATGTTSTSPDDCA